MRERRLITGILVSHTLLLALYTFPSRLVPEQLRIIGQLYARPLFHQQWRLFAPDPPLCDCRLQWSTAAMSWRDVEYRPGTYLHRRTLQSLARHIQAEVHAGDSIAAQELRRSLRGIVYHASFDPGRGRELPALSFRLVEQCVTDAHSPSNREERITLLVAP